MKEYKGYYYWVVPKDRPQDKVNPNNWIMRMLVGQYWVGLGYSAHEPYDDYIICEQCKPSAL